ncbi:hypothetical protein SAMN05216358_2620 [Rhizobium sp. AN5]|uniref:hypothetical protein n=1 Tax=Rhizobium sp. AN5 TaxID=1855304 RepID=UPI000BC647C8|nr:hypothetical protein [Rhizobium sp. AN5]SOC92469.1 hypothetical protein SAMN05216358_2620 [Rhizobium sp. AN5]
MTEQKHTPVSSDHIAEQIDAIAVTLSRLEREATKLSLAAVSGDEKAAQRLAEINADIERAQSDRVILQRAEKAALQIELAADNRAEEAKRQHHYMNAVNAAVELVGRAERLQAVIEEFGQMVLAIEADERLISSEMRLAKKEISPRAGQFRTYRMASVAVENVFGKGDFANESIAKIIRDAWAPLLEDAQPKGDE